MEVEDLKQRLVRAVEREKTAMARLRRAQTLFDKRYATRLRLQEKLIETDRQIANIIKRLERS